jgi:hypothetical protein
MSSHEYGGLARLKRTSGNFICDAQISLDNTYQTGSEGAPLIKLVFSYAHADEALRNELEKHLAPLKRQGLIEPWHDRRIVPGQEFGGQIERHFQDADIILLLVSPDFINSNYCYDVEMVSAIERHNRHEAVVIPVILRPCHWHDLPFGGILAATVDGKPVTQFPSLDEGFYQVVDAIKRASKDIAVKSKVKDVVSKPVEGPKPAKAVVVTTERSSNLRIKRTFTDHECDQARTECFEFVAKYFASSLDELKQRNPRIDVDFNRIDSKSFEAKIYADGERKCMCGIWTGSGHFGENIVFNFNGVTPNSYNESMTVQTDGYTLGFKPMGMAFHGLQVPENKQGSLLSFEGVAEYFWAMLIHPLQQ